MPVYSYKCEQCGHVFDELQSLNESRTIPCPKCGHVANRTITHAANFIFTGAGFYETDYKKKALK